MSEYMSITESAMVFATKAHDGQFRDFSKKPYITHPFRVAALLQLHEFSMEMITAAILHDVLEDTPVTEKEMRSEFGDHITTMVLFLTEPEKLRAERTLTKACRKAEFIKQLSEAPMDVHTIKLADIIDNTKDMIKYGHMNTGRAERFLFAKRTMLLSLEKGYGVFYDMAEKELDKLEAAILEWCNTDEEKS